MAYLFDKAFQVVMVFVFLLLFLILVGVGILFYMRAKKKGRTDEDEYYQELNRLDAQDFLGFDDIVDDMVCIPGHRRFIAAIRCQGYDVYSASSAQIAATFQGYIEFLSTITTPVTYRQYYVPMSIDYTRSMYQRRYEETEQELFHKNADRDELVARLNQVRGVDLVTEEALLDEIAKLQKEISDIAWRRAHLESQMKFMAMVCDETQMEPTMEEVYLVEWEYNPNEYSMELSEEEIHMKAIESLNGICGQMIGALSRCNVRAFRCKTEELIEMNYQQSHPFSAMEFKMPAVARSSIYENIITSDDFKKKQEAAYKDAALREGIRMAQAVEDITAATVVETGELADE